MQFLSIFQEVFFVVLILPLFYVDTDKLILKLICKLIGPRIAKTKKKKSKGMKKYPFTNINHANINQKKTEVVILLLDKACSE